MNARVSIGDGGYSAEGGRVVGIDAGEDVEIVISDGGEVAFEHLLDHARFVPERDKDRDGALGSAAEGGGAGARESAGGEEVDERDKEIVQPADQDPGRDGNQTGNDPMVEPFERNCRKPYSRGCTAKISGKLR